MAVLSPRHLPRAPIQSPRKSPRAGSSFECLMTSLEYQYLTQLPDGMRMACGEGKSRDNAVEQWEMALLYHWESTVVSPRCSSSLNRRKCYVSDAAYTGCQCAITHQDPIPSAHHAGSSLLPIQLPFGASGDNRPHPLCRP